MSSFKCKVYTMIHRLCNTSRFNLKAMLREYSNILEKFPRKLKEIRERNFAKTERDVIFMLNYSDALT